LPLVYSLTHSLTHSSEAMMGASSLKKCRLNVEENKETR
jgi:hypothetical protein